MEFKLRDYQELSVDKGLEVLLNGRREILVIPTSGGKSLILGNIAKQLTEGSVLVLSPNIEILKQNIDKIESYGIYPAVHSASLKRREFGKIIYATPKSVSYEVLKNQNIKYCIVDEVDFGSKSDSHTVKLLTKLGVKSVLGTTATPLHMDTTGQDGAVARIMTQTKKPFFTNLAHVVQIKEMVKKGFWSDIKYYDVYEGDENKILKLNSNGSDYTEDSTEDFFNKTNLAERVKTFLLRLPENESALVFVPSIKNAEELQKILPNSICVHSKLDVKDREEYVNGFKSGKYSICVTVLALAVGFDFPKLSLILDCAATNSSRTNYQKIGRVVRTHKDKTVGNIVDYVGNMHRFGDVRDLNFEHIEGYGWGLFSGEKLITEVVLDSKEETTKAYLKLHKKPKTSQFFFNDDVDGSPKISFGVNKGYSLKYLYFRKRYYLKFLIEKNFQFKEEDKEFERQLKEIYEPK